MSYAFKFDARACTGCKACQAACKDKNNLSVGVLWRRVIEVSGGSWHQEGAAWTNNVFSYNLSIACNHCVHPKCAGVCPTNAYHVREDGIVLLDSSKCIGCGYCNWACPYAVPQYDPFNGVMSKCNFCFDALDVGAEPACVAACPMRILGFEQVGQSQTDPTGLPLWETPGADHPFPLPAYSRTQPHLRLNPHPAMLNKLEKSVANREEIKPKHSKNELPLVAFTIMAQAAVGTFWVSQWLFWFEYPGLSSLRLFSNILVGILLALGMLISFAHLGNKKNVWRVFGNVRKSSLSREILFLSLFGAGWLLSAFFPFPALQFLTSCLGLLLIHTMAGVYRLRSMAVWNTWRTFVAFLLSAFLLGFYLTAVTLWLEAGNPDIEFLRLLPGGVHFVALLLLLGECYIATQGKFFGSVLRLRIGIILGTSLFLACGLIFPVLPGLYFFSLIFLLILTEEILGRWLFYSELDRRIL